MLTVTHYRACNLRQYFSNRSGFTLIHSHYNRVPTVTNDAKGQGDWDQWLQHQWLKNRSNFFFLVFLIRLHPFPSILQQFLNLLIFNLFIYFWLHWVFAAAHGLSLVAASGSYSSLWSASLSLRWSLLLWSTGSRCTGLSSCGTWAQQLRLMGAVVVAHGLQSAGSVAVAHWLSCSAACGILPHQGSNPCSLHWQVDS